MLPYRQCLFCVPSLILKTTFCTDIKRSRRRFWMLTVLPELQTSHTLKNLLHHKVKLKELFLLSPRELAIKSMVNVTLSQISVKYVGIKMRICV